MKFQQKSTAWTHTKKEHGSKAKMEVCEKDLVTILRKKLVKRIDPVNVPEGFKYKRYKDIPKIDLSKLSELNLN